MSAVLRRAAGAIALGIIFLATGCDHEADDQRVSVGDLIPSESQVQGILATPKVPGVVAGSVKGERYRMTFVVGGGTPPQRGERYNMNIPSDK